MAKPLVAVLDIGKTNAKVVVADPATDESVWTEIRPNAPAQGTPFRALDAEAIQGFMVDALTRCPHKASIGTIVPVAHGAAIALVKGNDLALPVLDYEEPALDAVAANYRSERPSFGDTFSPDLPLGLNLGRQLFFLETSYPQAFAEVDTLLLWPQYFAWRLTGVASSEVTSLGCHTDLWEPAEARFSALAVRRNWSRKFPAMRKAWDVVGLLHPAVATATGLDPDTRVLAGIHDSNASFLLHRLARDPGEPFAVLSSGTWTVILATGGSLSRLDEGRDCLANVDALGEPTATSRFMGGREYEAIAGSAGPLPTAAALDRVLSQTMMALPCFCEGGGPFQGQKGLLMNAETAEAEELAALATLYVALVADICLDLLQGQGSVAVEGPLAENPLFGSVLAALRPEQPVRLSGDRAGTVGGALCLARQAKSLIQEKSAPAKPLRDPRLLSYRAAWRQMVSARNGHSLVP